MEELIPQSETPCWFPHLLSSARKNSAAGNAAAAAQAGPRRAEQPKLGRAVAPLEALSSGAALKVKVKEEEEEEEGGSEHTLGAARTADRNSDSDYEDDEVLVALGEKSSMRDGSHPKKRRKRTADVLQEDSAMEGGEDMRDIVDEAEKDAVWKIQRPDMTICCSPKVICKVVRLLNESQRVEVKKLGFGCLFDFNMNRLGSYGLIAKFMDHLDPDTMVLDFGGERKLHITEHAIGCVLGLHRGDMAPPVIKHNYNLQSLREKLGIGDMKSIGMAYLIEKIQSGSTDKFTMQCFMMIVLTRLLACQSSSSITGSAWSMVQDIDNFDKMNWCKFIFDHLNYAANMWKKGAGKRYTVYGCCAFLVIYYLDNLDCMLKMSCIETPRVKFFTKEFIRKLEEADKRTEEDGFPTFGKLNLRTQKGTCYDDERTDPSKNAGASITIDIADSFPRPHNQLTDLSSSKSLCVGKENRGRQQNQQLDSQQIEEQELLEERRQEQEGVLFGNNDQRNLVHASQEAPAVADIPEDEARGERAQSNCEVIGGSEDGERPIPGHNVAVTNFVSDPVIAGALEPEIHESSLSKLVSLLTQAHVLVSKNLVPADVSTRTQNADLEQQVKELTEKLRSTEEELEATMEKLRSTEESLRQPWRSYAAPRRSLRQPWRSYAAPRRSLRQPWRSYAAPRRSLRQPWRSYAAPRRSLRQPWRSYAAPRRSLRQPWRSYAAPRRSLRQPGPR
ncbi:hypothetical protein ACP4OV_003939 [Aristida adscensionis]